MALTRKLLSAMGIEEDKIEQIIDAHTDVTSALKKERDDFKEKAETVDDIQKKLDTAEQKLKAYEGDGNETWEAKYNQAVADKQKAEQDLADYKNEIQAKETLEKKRTAYRDLLKEMKISEKRIDSVMRVSKIDEIELDKDGKIKDMDKLKDAIKTDWSDFIVSNGEEGANTATPPEGNGGGTGAGAPSYAAKRAARYHANLYGESKED